MIPLSFIGSHLLALVLPACFFSALVYLIGGRRGHAGLIASGRRAGMVVFVLLTLAVASLMTAFMTGEYGIHYVANYSSRALPFFYKVTGLWAGLDGSILFWTWLVSLYSFIVLHTRTDRVAGWMPVVNAVLMGIISFFAVIMVFANNPFAIGDPGMPDGKGLNPLLQNIAMVVHPPALYLGFTGFSVPFAFAIAALVTRKLDDTWVDETRRWTLVAWGFLTLGLILGGAWAYVELGWGGFWAWDPVENAALMPWLLATAYIHSVMIQKRRGLLLIWNVVLIILTFLMTIMGTYLTRSGVVQSVHAFSESHLGPFFLVFMGVVAVIGFYLVFTRVDDLRARSTLNSYLSKESAFLLNNVVLVVATVAVFWGTMFPTLSEWVTGDRITVGIPFFNTIMAPIGVTLLFLMGIGPMISWKKSSWANFRHNLLIPFITGIVSLILAFILGVRPWYVLATAGMGGLVLATIWLEFYRGVSAQRVQHKISAGAALGRLFVQSNRRYGGYVVHIGILLIYLGIAGTVYKSEADFALNPGEEYTFKGYRLQYVEPLQSESDLKLDVLAKVELSRNGHHLATLYPARYFYKSGSQPSTEVAIYQDVFEDVYLVMGALEDQTRRAEFRVMINPMISYVWLGGFVILLGLVIVLLPRVKAPKSTAAVILLCGLSLFHPAVVNAGEEQMSFVGSDPLVTEQSQPLIVERIKRLGEGLICLCGDCVRNDLKVCTCSYARDERKFILSLIQEGKSDDEIVARFVAKYGTRVLSVPPSRGFLGMGRVIPPILLVVGLAGGFLFIRRLRRSSLAKPPSPKPADDTYAAQLTKELEED